MAFLNSNNIYVFGYSVPVGSELRLHYFNKNDEDFYTIRSILVNKVNLPITERTLYFPFDIPNNDERFKAIEDFSLDEWIIAGGIFNIEEQNCYRVFLLNKKDHQFAVVYDIGAGAVFTFATNGFGVIDENNDYYDNEEVFDLIGADEETPVIQEPTAALPQYFDTLTPKIQPRNTYAPRQYDENGHQLYSYHPKEASDQRFVVNAGENKALFEAEEIRLERCSGFDFSDRILFYPHEAEYNHDISNLENVFKPEEWQIVAGMVASSNFVINSLIVKKDNPKIAFVCSLFKSLIFAAMTNGFFVDDQGTAISEDKILEQIAADNEENTATQETEEPKAEETKEEPAPEPQPEPVEEAKPEQVEEAPKEETDDEFVEKEEATTSLIPARRIYATKRYLKHIEEQKKKYKNEFTEKINAVHRVLMTASNEDLDKFLRINKSTEFNDLDNYSIYKFRFAKSGTFAADRIMYLRGRDCAGRGIEPDAIVLLYFTEISEHDHQGEKAREIEKEIENDIFLDLDVYSATPEPVLRSEVYRLAFKKESTATKVSYNQYGVLSISQNDLLHKDVAPCAFSGSAGTGKTLMSIDLYRSFKEDNPNQRILYLTYQEALKGQVQRSFEELGVQAECLTYKDLAYSVLGPDIKYRDQTDFKKWINEKYSMTRDQKNKLLKISSDLGEAADIVYVFYRGIAEGSSMNQTRRTAELLSRDEFLRETKGEEGFDQDTKSKIYDVAYDYYDHVKRHKNYTDNVCAEAIMKKPTPTYDAIIVDETQDLTELQILSVCSLLKGGSKKLYLFGDDNQAINPTIFTIENAAACIKMALGPGIEVPIQTLKEAYRSSDFLVNYINAFNQVKRKAIGAYGAENDAEERSVRKDEKGSVPRLVTSKTIEEALLTSPTAFQSDTVIIVPNDETKNHLIEAHPSLENDVATISEAKGREWDNVIIFNFLSTAGDLWDRMLSDEKIGRHSTLHRMLFNRFYVALTRARDRIIVVEDNVSKLISDSLLHALTPISKEVEISQYLTDTLTNDDWYTAALSSFSDRDYTNARRCIKKIPEAERNDEEKGFAEDLGWYSIFTQNPQEVAKMDISNVADFIDTFVKHNDTDILYKLYSVRGSTYKIRLLRLDEQSEEDALIQATDYLTSNGDKFTELERDYFSRRLIKLYKTLIQNRLTKMEDIYGGQK